MLADYAFSFKLGPLPPEGPEFAFVVEGWNFDKLVALTCTPPPKAPEPAPTPVQYTYGGGYSAYEDGYSYERCCLPSRGTSWLSRCLKNGHGSCPLADTTVPSSSLISCSSTPPAAREWCLK